MQNIEVAHKFFYDLGGSFERRSMTVSYDHFKYWSYGTVIGKITKDIDGNFICLVSDNNFSMTTAKHLNNLRSACRFEMYYLPQHMYDHDFYSNELIERLKNGLNYYSTAKLTQKANRNGFTHYYTMLKNTLKIEDFQQYTNEIKTILKEHEELFNTLNDDIKIKELKEKLAKQQKEKQAKLKKELEIILDNYSYLHLIQFAFGNLSLNEKEYTKEQQIELKAKLKKHFNPNNDLAFCWFNCDNGVSTSKHITVDRKEATTLLKIWKAGKLRHGMKIGCYTILQIMNNYIQIGCHKIPMENMKNC